MDKKTYDGQLRRQCFSLPGLCEEQIAGVKKGLEETIPKERLTNIHKVMITGCGDSYLAAKISIPAFKRYAGAFGSTFEACRNIDAARRLELSREADRTLVIAISASGGPARIAEALTRARQCGCQTLLITNSPESKGAKASEYLLNVNTPVFPEPGPGLRNYYASLCGLMAFAAYMGEANGTCPQGSLDGLFHALGAYTETFGKELERIDAQMFETAVKWKDITAVEAIGDYTDNPTAAFIAAKFVETDGMMTTVADSENWCHVNYFAHTPERLGTILVSTKRFHNFGRIKETLMTVSAIGRPALLITTGTAADYGAEDCVTVCTIPQAPEGFGFIEPVMSFVPGAILASYSAALHGEPYFRGPDSRQGKSAYGTSIQSSEIKIV